VVLDILERGEGFVGCRRRAASLVVPAVDEAAAILFWVVVAIFVVGAIADCAALGGRETRQA